MQDRCRTHPSLKDREDDILNAMQREVSTITDRYQHLETDSRSHTNIQIAAQTLATHKVLLPYVRNENEVMQMLKEQNGAKSEEGIRCVTVPSGVNSHGLDWYSTITHPVDVNCKTMCKWMARVGIFCRQTMLRQAPFAQVVRILVLASVFLLRVLVPEPVLLAHLTHDVCPLTCRRVYSRV